MNVNKEISIAPMMNYTNRHFRRFMRCITRHVSLYTEMLTTQQVIYGNTTQTLQFDPIEHPLTLQLGGSDLEQLKRCVEIANQYGYKEINLNVGCPSPRVQKGGMGACLFKMPEKVAECVRVMQAYSDCPITVKTRLGVDDNDKDADIIQFVELVSQAGCQTIILHARKAWLKGVNPRQNRSLPPLQYDRALQFKRHFPQLRWILNGGIQTREQLQDHLSQFDGVMIGRAACQNPYMFALIDADHYGARQVMSRKEILLAYQAYFLQNAYQTTRRNLLVKPLIQLLYNLKDAKAWRIQCVSLAVADKNQLLDKYSALIEFITERGY